jgi:hypothetical protein
MLPVLGVPVLVAAISGQQPVHVAKCNVWGPQTAVLRDGVPNTSGGYDLHVRFVNGADQPIRRIVFALDGGETVVDAGMFSPGARIDHMLPIAPNDGRSCSVASVTFADGTRWSAH